MKIFWNLKNMHLKVLVEKNYMLSIIYEYTFPEFLEIHYACNNIRDYLIEWRNKLNFSSSGNLGGIWTNNN